MESLNKFSQDSDSILEYESGVKSKKKDTLTRKDVLQKTIFRALRKEYAHFFNKFLEFNGFDLNYDETQYRKYLEAFVIYIKQWESNEEMLYHYGEFHHLPFIIGVMVDYCKIKKMKTSLPEKTLMDKLFGSSYKYSHVKFDEMLRIPEVKFLFRKLCGKDYVDTFISRHITLAKNKEDYKKCATAIIELIETRRYGA